MSESTPESTEPTDTVATPVTTDASQAKGSVDVTKEDIND